MKPFSVSCTTCRARLKVLDPAAIGQILACPKCNSMVQIVPPPDWTPDDEGEQATGEIAAGEMGASSSATAGLETRSVPSAQSHASAAAAPETAPTAVASSKVAASKVAASKATPPPLPQPIRATTEAASSAGLIAAAFSGSTIAKREVVQSVAMQPPVKAPALKQPAPKQPAAAHQSAVHSATSHVQPVASLENSEAASSRWFWPTFSAATFLALAAAALVIYLDRHNRVSADATSSGSAAQAVENPLVAAGPSATVSVSPSAIPTQPSKPTVADKATSAPTTPIAPPAAAPPAVAPTVAIQPPPVPPLAVSRVAPTPAPAAIVAPAVAPPDPAVVPDATADTPPVVPPAAPAEAPAAAQALARPSLQRIPPRDVDVNARLADHIAAIEFQQSPLSQFLGDLSQLSTVPISIDVDALAEMNLPADLPISVQLKNTTLAGVLDEALAGHGLGWRAVGHQIVVGRPAVQELRRVRYAVADLAGEQPESRRQFAALVHSLVDPNGWSEANGSATSEWSEGALMVTAGPSAHAQMLVFCEKLRLARGLPLRSRIDPACFHLDSRTAHAKAALDAPITVNFARPESLEKILAYLRSTTRLNLLVDRIALAEDGMSAESEAALLAQRQPIGAALTSLLDPVELTYRAIDDRTFEITTPKAAARHAEVEFYPAADLLAAGADGHELVARITRELHAAAPAGAGAAPATIRFDVPSKYMIVRAPQSLQHRVESLLGTWRVAKQ